MGHAARLSVCLFALAVGVEPCDVGTACHLGASHAYLTDWLVNRPVTTSTDCHALECIDRRAQVLLSRRPTSCSAAIDTAWNALRAQCGSVGGVCCPDCALAPSTHCDISPPPHLRYAATAYAAVATVLAVAALSSPTPIAPSAAPFAAL